MIEEEVIIQRLTRREISSQVVIEIPNTSGDHLRAVKTNTPSIGQDLANKKYVDDAVTATNKIGNALTYVEVDTANNKIVMFINGVQVNEWS